jgi:hypothetical protein
VSGYHSVVNMPETIRLYLRASAGWSGAPNATDIVVRELPYWREAIWIDMESTGMNAVGSIVQERPIEITPAWNGKIRFSLNADRDQLAIASSFIRSHVQTDQNTPNASSDAIVYYSDVDLSLDEEFAAADGFLTRIMRLPNLEADAMESARVLQDQARQHQKVHDVTCRPDAHIEPGDEVEFFYSTPGGASAHRTMIVEGVSLQIVAEGGKINWGMGLQGRDADV